MLGESLLKDLFGSRYTIGELMRIDQERQDKARGCKVSLMDTFFTIKEESLSGKVKKLFTGKDSVKVFYITLKLAVTGDTGNPHIVFIQLEPDFSMKNWENNKVRIYCDCADFKYRSAYLLDKRDSIFANDGIKIALGQAISEVPKGKRGVTLLCKHSFAALTWLMNNYTNLMSTL